MSLLGFPRVPNPILGVSRPSSVPWWPNGEKLLYICASYQTDLGEGPGAQVIFIGDDDVPVFDPIGLEAKLMPTLIAEWYRIEDESTRIGYQRV